MSGSADRLAPRHRDCLRLVYERRTTKEIARELGLADGTVSTYVSEAVALLGARDRRHAAEILHGLENGPPVSDPIELGASSAWVDSDAPPVPPSAPAALPAHLLGPLAPANRDADNDASITTRLAWIVGLAIGLAIAFGSIVGAARAISDVVRAGSQ